MRRNFGGSALIGCCSTRPPITADYGRRQFEGGVRELWCLGACEVVLLCAGAWPVVDGGSKFIEHFIIKKQLVLNKAADKCLQS